MKPLAVHRKARKAPSEIGINLGEIEINLGEIEINLGETGILPFLHEHPRSDLGTTCFRGGRSSYLPTP